jgi:hypothetical protein
VKKFRGSLHNALGQPAEQQDEHQMEDERNEIESATVLAQPANGVT